MDELRNIVKKLSLSFLLAILGAVYVFAEVREFRSADGRPIHAELMDIRKNADGILVVELRRSDRRYFTVPVSNFSEADQLQFREDWNERMKERSLLRSDHRVEISLKLNRKTQDKEIYAYNYSGGTQKDKETLYRPEAVIQNDELTQSFTGNRVRIVVIARSRSESGKYLIAAASTEEIDIPAKDSVSVEGQPFTLREYEYKSGYDAIYNSEYGYEKDDYVVLVYNREGEITHRRASSNRFLDNIEAVENCRAGEIYSDRLEYRMSSKPDSYYYQSLD